MLTWPIERFSPSTPTSAGASHAIPGNGWCSVAQGSRANGAQTARRCAGRAGAVTDYIGSEKRILHRCLAERGVALTAEAQARLAALPERFTTFIAALDGLDHEVAA